ncbi:translation initiation factor IF3-1, mitochondrial [Impatiens glandulifera]|uniref:translation initiation factor IF3-1, mitochondrial n=1 Tax=Impatiens glandulifera TaxID=253017 RepID=UPI001FB11BC4|nr:translation initiation factor IF3-1, mitochondrial [Impatiens glandulifera]
MAFLCRIKQSKLNNISNQFRRWYFQVPGGLAERNIPSVIRIPSIVDQRRIPHDFFYSNVRFLSAQVKKPNNQGAPTKEKEEESDEPRLNEKITAEFIRLVSDEGHYVMPKREALENARKLNLDLVEVQRNGKPPVCKIMDYNREKFAKQTKDKVRVKENKTKDTLKTGACKEIRFPVKAEQKDLQMKADAAKKLMEKGYRVKCTVVLDNKKKQSTPSGKEGDEFGGYILRVSNLISEFSVIESVSKGEKSAYLVARHVKFGQLKKAKKISIEDFAKSELPEDDDGELNGVFDVEEDEKVPSRSSGPKEAIQTRPNLHGQRMQSQSGLNPGSGMRTGASTPANDISKPKLPHPTGGPGSSTGTSYGIFSRPSKDNGDSSGGGGRPAEDNRYKKGSGSSSTRVGGNSPNQGPNGSSGGKWGIFSGEGSNPSPNPNGNSGSRTN